MDVDEEYTIMGNIFVHKSHLCEKNGKFFRYFSYRGKIYVDDGNQITLSNTLDEEEKVKFILLSRKSSITHVDSEKYSGKDLQKIKRNTEVGKDLEKSIELKRRETEKRKMSRKMYKESNTGKNTQKMYEESERGKTKRKMYEESETGKNKRKMYEESETGKNTRKMYEESEAGLKRQKMYEESETGKNNQNYDDLIDNLIDGVGIETNENELVSQSKTKKVEIE